MEIENELIKIKHLDLHIKNVISPKWGDEGKNFITCILVLSNDLEIPFNAHKEDTEEHGVALFKKIMNEDYGKISKYKTEKQSSQQDIDPATKLKKFLLNNPDVKKWLETE